MVNKLSQHFLLKRSGNIRFGKHKLEKIICTLMFIVALFTVAKTWNRPNCSFMDECIKEYYSVIKSEEILSFVTYLE